jgi:hypothetical protein
MNLIWSAFGPNIYAFNPTESLASKVYYKGADIEFKHTFVGLYFSLEAKNIALKNPASN